jgi:tetratricopeptide (TPR) repeat protein
LRLVRLDDTSAAVSMGSLVLARAELRNGAALTRLTRTAPLEATIAAQSASRWRIAGSIAFDDECTLDVDATLPVEVPEAPIARSVAALALYGRALDATADGQLSSATALADQALEALGAATEQPVVAAMIAAFAIERAIDQAQFGRAQQLVERFQPVVKARLDPEQPASLRFELATIRVLPWPQALTAREKLAPRLAATFGERSEPALENRVRHATNLMVLDRSAAAIAEFEALEDTVRFDPRPLSALRFLLARYHANALSLLGRHEAQLARLRSLREQLVKEHGDDNRRVVDLDADMARGLADAARLPEAIAVAARVYLWRERVLGADHARTKETVQLLALLFGRVGRFATARALLEHVLRRIDPVSDLELSIRARRDVATWAAMEGEASAALDLMGQSYQAARERFSDTSLQTVGIAIDYGWLLLRAGDPERACGLLEAARRRAPAANGLREFADAGLARCLLARSQSTAADTERALGLLNDAVKTSIELVGADNPRALVWQSMLAGAELRAGRRAQAKQRLVEFVHRAERNREKLAAGSITRDSTFGLWIAENDSMAGYRTLALLHAQDGDLDAALRVAELARDRQLRDRFAERRWLQLPADFPETTRLRDLQAQRQGLDESIATADVSARVRLEAVRIGVVESIDALERDLALRFPQRAVPLTPTVAAIQARLAPDTALVAYQRAGDAWWITWIDRKTARLLPIRDAGNVAAAARAWARAVRGEPVRVWALDDGRWVLSYVRPPRAVARVPISVVARRLGAALFGPLTEPARHMQRLVVVADDDLVGLPLDALSVNGGATPALMRYQITYAASFGGWIELRDRAPRHGWPRDLLALGAIEDPSTASPAIQTVGTRGSLAPLPFARAEIAQIARSFPPSRVRMLLDGEATKASLAAASQSGELAGYRFVHFATHALVEPAFIERATLVLAPVSGTEADLTATELAGLVMGSQLVVLSACDTGVGRYEQGQGLLGFAFAALAAGNQAAVLSLWPVADDTTARLMAHFYARMRDGLSPAAALTATKREFARSRDSRERDPRVWSAFVLYGGS